MKKQFHCLKLFLLLLFIIISLSSSSQKQFTHVSSKANNSCNGDCTLLDIPELYNNRSAIIFVTPVMDKGATVNPHPIGVYYVGKKWNIFNLDQTTIPEGAKFNVEYLTEADATHFQYSITNEDLQKDGSAFIDHQALNNNPNAQPRFFHNWVPDARGVANREEISIKYNAEAGKWAISNVNKKPLFARVAYNIVIASAGSSNTQPTTYNAVQIKELTTEPSKSAALGSISQMYMTIWVAGTKLPGDNMIVGFLDKTRIQSFEMGVSGIAASGQVMSGKRAYEPFTIKSYTGFPATLPLFDAYIKNQDMVFLIETFTPGSSSGKHELNYTMKLSGARMVSFRQVYEETSFHTSVSSKKFYDEIKIIFSKIEIENAAGYIVVDEK